MTNKAPRVPSRSGEREGDMMLGVDFCDVSNPILATVRALPVAEVDRPNISPRRARMAGSAYTNFAFTLTFTGLL